MGSFIIFLELYMCGILIVKSPSQLNHLPALEVLKKRGPDYTITQQIGDVFIAQTVLHITGTPKFYFQKRDDGFAYNGEIYNYKSFGPYDNDVELAYETAKHKPQKFKEFEGPWAWGFVHNKDIMYACDPQGERRLYQYVDNDLIIVCSEVAPILTYINTQCEPPPYVNKAWTMLKDTPWKNIHRCESGMLYHNGIPVRSIDSIFEWDATPSNISLHEALEDFSELWPKVLKDMTPQESVTISYSGGIDSRLVAKELGNKHLLTIDIEDKDPIVKQLNVPKIKVNAEEWAYHCKDIISSTKMPLQCWSDVGKWLIAKHSLDRIIFTGTGADELFGGYGLYQNLQYDNKKSYSPYSDFDHERLWPRCLKMCKNNPGAATLLMDYWYEVVGVNATSYDRICGFWGKEARHPFLHQKIMKFALKLPLDLKVGTYPKLLLRTYYKQQISNIVDPKQGFAGHANDSLPWLDIKVDHTDNRNEQWKQISQKAFMRYVN